MQITAKVIPIREIYKYDRISVPDFQRNFSWRAEQIESLFETISPAFLDSDPDPVFLGPVTVLDRSLGTDIDLLELIDGQQRVTSFSLIFCVLRDIVETLTDKRVVLSDGTDDRLDFKLYSVLRNAGGSSPRLIANYQIKSVYMERIYADPDVRIRTGVELTSGGAGLSAIDRINTSDLRSAYFRIKQILSRVEWLGSAPTSGTGEEEFKQRIYRLLTVILEQCCVVRISVDSHQSAFILFETLNDRGLDLTQSDLVKAFLLKEIYSLPFPTEELRQDFLLDKRDQWDAAATRLEQTGSGKFSMYLRHYLIALRGERVTGANVFKKFVELTHSGLGAVAVLGQLAEAAALYERLLTATVEFGDPSPLPTSNQNMINSSLRRLSRLGDTYKIVLLKGLLVRANAEQMRRLVEVVECLAFRWIATGGNAQKIENHYALACAILNESSDLNDGIDRAIRFLESEMPTDEQVSSFFKELSEKSDVVHYVMNRIAYGIAGIDHTVGTIEHLAPQRPVDGQPSGDYWFDHVAPKEALSPGAPVYTDFVQKWGNLTLLEIELQPSISNAPWPNKIGSPGLGDSTFALTTQLVTIPNWTSQIIDQRSQWILDRIVDLTSTRQLRHEALSSSPGFISI